jgi:hypothetical protein
MMNFAYRLNMKCFSWVPVACACNLSYSGGRDQEDLGLKPRQIVHEPLSKKQKCHHKKGLVDWLKV